VNTRLRHIAVLVAVAIIAASAPPPFWNGSVVTAAAKLSDLRGVDELKTLFNKDKGKTRLVLLVSPT
jgi:hypothetical protein